MTQPRAECGCSACTYQAAAARRVQQRAADDAFDELLPLTAPIDVAQLELPPRAGDVGACVIGLLLWHLARPVAFGYRDEGVAHTRPLLTDSDTDR